VTRATALAGVAALGLAGCTVSDGDWFAELSPRLVAALDTPADRDAGGGWQRLDTDFQVRFDALAVTLADLELREPAGAGAAFDPANPPPGYSLCHNGHCHADDGRLVPYDEVAAELAGGGGPRVVVRLPVDRAVDVAGGDELVLACEPGCGLPLADIRSVAAPVTRVAVIGTARDGREPPRFDGEVPLELDLDLTAAPAVLAGVALLPADRDHDPDVTLTVELRLTGRLLDGIDLAPLAAGGAIDLTRLIDNLTSTELVAHIER
jgi:hypothetical protein